jgi:hypothetical protein
MLDFLTLPRIIFILFYCLIGTFAFIKVSNIAIPINNFKNYRFLIFLLLCGPVAWLILLIDKMINIFDWFRDRGGISCIFEDIYFWIIWKDRG